MGVVIFLLVVIALAHLEDALFVAFALIGLCARVVFSYVGLFVGTLLITSIMRS